MSQVYISDVFSQNKKKKISSPILSATMLIFLHNIYFVTTNDPPIKCNFWSNKKQQPLQSVKNFLLENNVAN